MVVEEIVFFARGLGWAEGMRWWTMRLGGLELLSYKEATIAETGPCNW